MAFLLQCGPRFLEFLRGIALHGQRVAWLTAAEIAFGVCHGLAGGREGFDGLIQVAEGLDGVVHAIRAFAVGTLGGLGVFQVAGLGRNSLFLQASERRSLRLLLLLGLDGVVEFPDRGLELMEAFELELQVEIGRDEQVFQLSQLGEDFFGVDGGASGLCA